MSRYFVYYSRNSIAIHLLVHNVQRLGEYVRKNHMYANFPPAFPNGKWVSVWKITLPLEGNSSGAGWNYQFIILNFEKESQKCISHSFEVSLQVCIVVLERTRTIFFPPGILTKLPCRNLLLRARPLEIWKRSTLKRISKLELWREKKEREKDNIFRNGLFKSRSTVWNGSERNSDAENAGKEERRPWQARGKRPSPSLRM